MPVTTEITPDLVVEPFAGDESPVAFGIEHEYNRSEFDTGRRFFTTPVVLPPGWVQHSEHCGWEIKTPPTTALGDVIATFRDLEERLGATHRNCGLHVHLNVHPTLHDGKAMNPVKFAELYRVHKPYLWSIVPAEDDTVGRTTSRSYGTEMPYERAREVFNVGQPRGELNVNSMFAHGTIEVRLAAGTSDMDAFERWVRTLVALAADSVYVDDPLIELADYIDVDRVGPSGQQRKTSGGGLRSNLIASWARRSRTNGGGLGQAAFVETLLSSKRGISRLGTES